jgi:hypothetical protein
MAAESVCGTVLYIEDHHCFPNLGDLQQTPGRRAGRPLSFAVLSTLGGTGAFLPTAQGRFGVWLEWEVGDSVLLCCLLHIEIEMEGRREKMVDCMFGPGMRGFADHPSVPTSVEGLWLSSEETDTEALHCRR